MVSRLRIIYSANKSIAVVFFHFFALLGCYWAMDRFGLITTIPNEKNLLNWDAYWYDSIRETGYKFVAGTSCNLAFFPLFPLFWKATALSAFGICCINTFIFAATITILQWGEKVSGMFLLLIMAMPSLVFNALPYSEAFFFLFGALLIKGYEQNSTPKKTLGILGASLTKSVSTVFIPAILLVELFDRNKQAKRYHIDVIINVCSGLLGTFLVGLLQWHQTGRWFYFFEVQKYWKRRWIFPRFPLTTYRAGKVLAFDGIGFSVGLLALACCLRWFYLLWLKRGEDKLAPNNAVLFSALTLTATLILDTCFTFNDGGATSIWSINRHLLCSPFTMTFLSWLYNNISKSKLQLYISMLIICICIYLTGVFRFPLMLLYYCLFFSTFIFLRIFPSYRYYLIIIYVASVALQIQTFYDFLNNKWVG